MSKKKSKAEQAEYSVSVVMPTYHTGPVLIHAIKAVLAQKHLKELILVDNGNSDYVRGKIEEFCLENDKLHVISGQGNIGFARACNLGVREAHGDYLLLLNPGCVLPTNALGKAVKTLEKNPEAWIAGCKLVDIDGKEQKGNRRNLMTFKNLTSEWFSLYKFFFIPRFELSSNPIAGDTAFVPAISSAFMLMERERYVELGKMDKKYFVHIEDLDICFQVNQMGGKIVFANNLEVVHYGKTSDVPRLAMDKHIARGLCYYFRKNFNGAYFPGAIAIIYLIIYLRFVMQAILFGMKRFKSLFKNPFKSKKEIACYKNFVQTYKEFAVDPKTDVRNPKYYIGNRAPYLITDTESQIGVSILRRLLAANVEVVALYKERPIDIYHPKLTWVKSDIDHKLLDLPKNTRINTVIYTSAITAIPPYIEKFASVGAKRLIAFCPLFASNKHTDIDARKQSVAEQDIARICAKKEIKYTIMRTPIVYGLGINNCVVPIYKFVKRFGRFPTKYQSFYIYPPVHADDLAIAALKILNIEETYGKSYNLLGDDKQLTYQDIIDKIFKSLDKKERVSSSSVWLAVYKLYTKLTDSLDINYEIQKYKEEGYKVDSLMAKKDFGFSASEFLNATKEDLGIDKT